MFQFARLSLACPWIQQQFERLTYSGISGSTLIFNSPKHFVAYYALPRLWVPRDPARRGLYHERSKEVNLFQIYNIDSGNAIWAHFLRVSGIFMLKILIQVVIYLVLPKEQELPF
ncbi:unnamed protein product [Linum trigynum]|uniref:Uncharacterized protein n=1 Tax=Linum trigynum TaxID=586398 RepID=A0AAV2E5Z0_9ROSI